MTIFTSNPIRAHVKMAMFFPMYQECHETEMSLTFGILTHGNDAF